MAPGPHHLVLRDVPARPDLTGYRPFHPDFGYLFNSYYEAVGARYPRTDRGLVSRPGVAEIAAYRRHVDEAMARLLDGPRPADAADLVELGIHHEQQHQELLLMDIKHVLSRNPLRPAYGRSAVPAPVGRAADRGWIEHAGRPGRDRPRRAAASPSTTSRPATASTSTPFAIADRPVTCGEWLAFIDDGGYHRPELWLSDGWAAVSRRAGRPRCTGRRPSDGDWQDVHPGRRRAGRPGRAGLPRELLRGRRLRPLGRRPAAHRGRVGGGRGRPARSGATSSTRPSSIPRPGRRAGRTGSSATSGSGRRRAYSPYPGFRPAPGAVGEYNGKFMVNQYVLRGGRASPRRTTSGPPTATSSRPRPAGPSRGLRLARDC